MAKSVFAFANTEGGFIVFGVDQRGHWTGLPRASLAAVDPSRLTEVFNSYVAPEVQYSYEEFQERGRHFALLHVPPSRFLPHVTIKDACDRIDARRQHTIIAKHSVYVRYGAKSDLASPAHHERIIASRTEQLRQELLRRIREVPVPFLDSRGTGSGLAVPGAMRVLHVTSDPSAPLVRITRDASEASGVILHEDLAHGLFDEINNVLAANQLVAGGEQRFLFGEQVYYRIYAERQHVTDRLAWNLLLAQCGLNRFYAPNLFWLLRLGDSELVDVLTGLLRSERHPFVNFAIRAVVVLGQTACEWLDRRVRAKWADFSQPLSYVFTFARMREQLPAADRRLVVLGLGKESKLAIPGEPKEVPVMELMESPSAAASALSRCCMAVFRGEGSDKTTCRQLDMLAYGRALEMRADDIVPLLKRKRLWHP